MTAREIVQLLSARADQEDKLTAFLAPCPPGSRGAALAADCKVRAEFAREIAQQIAADAVIASSDGASRQEET